VAESKRKTNDGMRSKPAAHNKDVAFVLPASARDDSEAAVADEEDYVGELFMFGQQYDSCVKDNSGEIFPGKIPWKIPLVKDLCLNQRFERGKHSLLLQAKIPKSSKKSKDMDKRKSTKFCTSCKNHLDIKTCFVINRKTCLSCLKKHKLYERRIRRVKEIASRGA